MFLEVLDRGGNTKKYFPSSGTLGANKLTSPTMGLGGLINSGSMNVTPAPAMAATIA
jgi:hypothetical protein